MGSVSISKKKVHMEIRASAFDVVKYSVCLLHGLRTRTNQESLFHSSNFF